MEVKKNFVIPKPIILCIMDGFGISNRVVGNAILAAKKPKLDALFARYPHRELLASGEAVGLPKGQMGNSEVGHMNLGAGRIVYQSLTLLDSFIQNGTFYHNPTLCNSLDRALHRHSKVHLMGLLGDGGVHAHQRHLYALLETAAQRGIQQVFLHLFLDGRDVEPDTAPQFIEEMILHCKQLGIGTIASISGRYFAMDRDKNFTRLDQAYGAIVRREGPSFSNPVKYIRQEYQRMQQAGTMPSDEYVLPAYAEDHLGQVQDGDLVLFANFRPDRAIQLATILTNPMFYVEKHHYSPQPQLHNIDLVSMMKYADSVQGEIAFELPPLTSPLGPFLASKGYHQLRIAETEKYAHVTFFFDGTVNYDGRERPELQGCKRILIPSPKVATYDQKPEMSAYEVKESLLRDLKEHDYDVVILNFANCDMVGHTADLKATIRAVETVDECVGEIADYAEKVGGVMLILADHGNAESLRDESGQPLTAHTTNPVPFLLTSTRYQLREGDGKLADVAPTILKLLQCEIPEEMSGKPLINDRISDYNMEKR